FAPLWQPTVMVAMTVRATPPATAAIVERTRVAGKASPMTARDRRPTLLVVDGLRATIATLLANVRCGGRKLAMSWLVLCGRPGVNTFEFRTESSRIWHVM